METRALLAFVISVAILIGYQALFAPPPPTPGVGEDASRAAANRGRQTPPTEPGNPAPVVPRVPVLKAPPPGIERVVEVRTELYRAELTSFGGRLKSFELSEYRTAREPGSPPLDLVDSESLLPFGVYWTAASGSVASDTHIVYEIESGAGRLRDADETTITMSGEAPDGTRVTKTLRVRGDSYVVDLDVHVDVPHHPSIGVAWARKVRDAASRFAGTEGPVAFIDGELHAETAASLAEPIHERGVVSWAGYADHYFLAAYYPSEPRPLRFLGAASAGLGEAQLWADETDGRVAYQVFLGPKRIHLLGSLGHGLDEAIDLGWFAFVARPLLELMLQLNKVTGNYGWAIILLTIGIRIVFYPVNKKQANAMKAMQRIQPELKKLQEKYKDDRERLNKEMMETYRRHKVNPLAGCLPMLLQLPVFLGLYNALMQAIELRHAPFISWIDDLSQPDRLGAFAIPFVSPPGIPVMTLLMGASMFVQQKMTPAMGDPTQQRMMMFLPLVFTVMFINFPAGLVLYWFANNVMSIAQQYMTNRAK